MEYYCQFTFVSITCFDSRGQLLFDSTIREIKYCTFKTVLSDYLLARIITGKVIVFSSGCCSLFIGEMISYCSRISNSLFTLSCKCIGTLLARCF